MDPSGECHVGAGEDLQDAVVENAELEYGDELVLHVYRHRAHRIRFRLRCGGGDPVRLHIGGEAGKFARCRPLDHGRPARRHGRDGRRPGVARYGRVLRGRYYRVERRKRPVELVVSEIGPRLGGVKGLYGAGMVRRNADIGDDVPVRGETEDGEEQDEDHHDEDHEAPLVSAAGFPRAPSPRETASFVSSHGPSLSPAARPCAFPLSFHGLLTIPPVERIRHRTR